MYVALVTTAQQSGSEIGIREQAGESVLSEKVVGSCAHAARAK